MMEHAHLKDQYAETDDSIRDKNGAFLCRVMCQMNKGILF